MEELPSSPDEKKLSPSPEEKLLRTRTFLEKYGRYFWLILTLLLLILILAGVYIAANSTTKIQQTPQILVPTQSIPTLLANPTEYLYREPSGSAATSNWKTYTDSNLNYSFQYPPPSSCVLQESVGDTSFALCYLPKGSDGGPKHNNGYVITLGFISQGQLNVMGVSYCGAYPNDSSRCESFKIGKVTASIDWATGNAAKASAWISHPNGGIVTFDLQPVTAESKEILRQILSTFKFTK